MVREMKNDQTICPICRATRSCPLFTFRLHPYIIRSEQAVVMHGCETCGVLFQHPLPSPTEISAFYNSNTGWEAKYDAARDISHLVATKRQRFADLYQLLISESSFQSAGVGRRVFDFGCGFGSFLDLFKAGGWHTAGLEPGREAREFAVAQHQMYDEIPGDERFDLIIVSHVLEHLLDPLETLKQLAGLLPENGLVYAAVPCLSRLNLHRNASAVFNGAHLYAFTARSLANLLALSGLRVVALLNSSAWDQADSNGKPLRLRCLAQKQPEVSLEPDPPLPEAIRALTRYRNSLGLRSRLISSLPVGLWARYLDLRA
jgi:SAM-dependent methyltransferase